MKDISSAKNSKDVIRGTRLNRETLYYTVLFGVAAITSLVLFILGISYRNTGLIVYTAILMPLFTLSALATLRLTVISKDTICVENGTLVIKSFLVTRRIAIADLGKVTVATNNKNNVTTINITYGKTTVSYTYKDFTKEEIAHLRRATSKY